MPTLSRQRTREHLLDVAERMLASRGFAALTIRELTREAGVNIATVNYVFGSKDGLLRGLHERMFIPMTRGRLERFDALEAAGDLDTRDLVRALIEPLARMREQHGASAVELYWYLVLHSDEQVRAATWTLLGPGMRRFEQLILAALPQYPRDALLARVALVCQLAVPTTLRALDVFELGGEASDLEPLIDLLAGGLEAGGTSVETSSE